MHHIFRICLFIGTFLLSINHTYSLEQADRDAIQEVIHGYADAWNNHAGRGFGDGFAENADFVNIFGMHFIGKAEIEDRHIKILQSFLKGSSFEILDTKLREIQPGVVIAHIRWKVQGFGNPKQESDKTKETREGIFTQVFSDANSKWEIVASQNTLVAK